jgi:hypothetical protein
MIDSLLDPVVLCFVAGFIAGVFKSELRFPKPLYDTLSLYLLLSIGLKGGVELAKVGLFHVVSPFLGTLFLGVSIPLVAYFILRKLGKFDTVNSASIAAHYGSVSAVTFAVVLNFLKESSVSYEPYVSFLLVVLEVPALVVGILLAKKAGGKLDGDHSSGYGEIIREIVLGKSLFLLLAGLVIGYLAPLPKIMEIDFFFFKLFKGALCLFLMELGLTAARHVSDLKRVGAFLFTFAITMPVISAVIGIIMAKLSGLSLGGATVLATLAASASYIAAPAAMRIALPEANPTYSLTSALGVTFPFNIIVGVPVYYIMAKFYYGLF